MVWRMERGGFLNVISVPGTACMSMTPTPANNTDVATGTAWTNDATFVNTITTFSSISNATHGTAGVNDAAL